MQPTASTPTTADEARDQRPAVILTLPKCIIRRYALTDDQAIAYHSNNPLIPRFMGNAFPYPNNLADAQYWINKCLEDPNGYEFVIADPINGTAIGGMGLKTTPAKEINALSWGIGYWLGQEHWGKGIITEALTGLIDWAFEGIIIETHDGGKWGLQRLYAEVMQGNNASMAVLGRCGLKLEGIERRSRIKHGVIVDQHVFGITRDDWEASKKAKTSEETTKAQ